MSKRVVSLIASATEIVCALGREDDLVGISHECDYPRTIVDRPKLTEAKLPTDGTSLEIDANVKEIVQNGLSVYRVDAVQLDALRPDLIVTQSQCEVCAVSQRDVEEAVCQMVHSRPQVVSLEPNGLDDVFADIARVAAALDIEDGGQSLVKSLRERMTAVAERVRTVDAKPRVACVEWIDPLMAAGNWMPELVSMAGGDDIFGTPGEHSPWLGWDELVEADPDVVLVLPCGWDMDRAEQEMPALTARKQWPRLRAVQAGRVCLTDGNQYFNRPGPRLAESLEILAEIFHPDVFDFGHRDTAWRPYHAG